MMSNVIEAFLRRQEIEKDRPGQTYKIIENQRDLLHFLVRFSVWFQYEYARSLKFDFTSIFRDEATNRKVGGVRSSKHLLGLAADFIVENENDEIVFQAFQKFAKEQKRNIAVILYDNNRFHVDIYDRGHNYFDDLRTKKKT